MCCQDKNIHGLFFESIMVFFVFLDGSLQNFMLPFLSNFPSGLLRLCLRASISSLVSGLLAFTSRASTAIPFNESFPGKLVAVHSLPFWKFSFGTWKMSNGQNFPRNFLKDVE
jgi:hypothetical protein